MDGTGPARVPEGIIAEIRSRERGGLIELPKPPGLQRGDRSESTSGAVRRTFGDVPRPDVPGPCRRAPDAPRRSATHRVTGRCHRTGGSAVMTRLPDAECAFFFVAHGAARARPSPALRRTRRDDLGRVLALLRAGPRRRRPCHPRRLRVPVDPAAGRRGEERLSHGGIARRRRSSEPRSGLGSRCLGGVKAVAERVGFEPTVDLRPRKFSRPVP